MEVRKVHNFEGVSHDQRYIIDLSETEAFEFDQFIADHVHSRNTMAGEIHNTLYGLGLDKLYKAKWRKEYNLE